jgi:hypothetical protein
MELAWKRRRLVPGEASFAKDIILDTLIASVISNGSGLRRLYEIIGNKESCIDVIALRNEALVSRLVSTLQSPEERGLAV